MPISESDSITRALCKLVARAPSPVLEAKHLHETLVGPHGCLGP